MKIIEEFEVSRSPKEVFEFIAVNYFENHQKFDPEIHGMINHSKGVVRKGTKGSEVRKVAGRRVTLNFEVTEYVTPKLFAFINTSGPLHLERSYKIEPFANGSKITFGFDVRPGNPLVKPIFPLLIKIFRKNVHHNIQILNKLLS